MRPFFFFRFSKMCRTSNLAACLQDACECVRVCVCVSVFVRVCGAEVCMYWEESRVRMASTFLTVCFGFLQKASARNSWRQRPSICSCISPSNPSMRECVKHPDLSCRYQNRVLIIYTLCTVVFLYVPQSWSLYRFTRTNSPSKRFVALHMEIPYLHDESPQKCNALYVCHLHDGFIDGNACWASIITSQTWNNKKHVKHQEIKGQKKRKRKEDEDSKKKKKNRDKVYRLIFSFPFCISSQWIGHMMIHAVHRWGTFSRGKKKKY